MSRNRNMNRYEGTLECVNGIWTRVIKAPKEPTMTISNRMPAVVVEYTSRDQRITKEFANAYAARRFYLAKSYAGKEPKLVSKSTV